MRRGLTARLPDPLQAEVDRRLDARLDPTSRAPLALGLSGGSDSLALLHLAADWCARRRRPLLALTIDHGLSPESGDWTAFAAACAARAGARWRALSWSGPKPAAGLPAAARAARHALLAEAARHAGAAVLLLAHTADDHAETEAMRSDAVPAIGRLREWAPSPAWPQGRGLFLLRPLLAVGRAALRARLVERRLTWLEDPANVDLRFARARLRAQGSPSRPPPSEDPPLGFGEATGDGRIRLSRARFASADPVEARCLAAALTCAAGADGPPRGGPLGALLTRLAEGGPAAVVSTLNGARVEARDGIVTVGRDLGRIPPAEVAIPERGSRVWDGRVEASAAEPGWRVGAAAGRLARLPGADRALLQPLAPALRRAHPVLVRGDVVRLQVDGVTLQALVPARFDAAVGRVSTEADLRFRAAESRPPSCRLDAGPPLPRPERG